MSILKIITTNDGSHSLLHEALNETYHSTNGAIQESTHVFIKNGFDFVLEKKKDVKILEVGFGTGLNTWLTLKAVGMNNPVVHYTSLDAFPIEESIWSQLNYAEGAEDKTLFEKIHGVTWNESHKITPQFQLRKLKTTLQEVELGANHYDLIYFDAFAPNKQPEMWQFPLLQKVVASMNSGAAFVTYCAQGQLKRDLKSLGLVVESLPGSPGKREMVRASKA
jgi:tRNA U34 5-methylaminomethyl-2-thiouridine-forming methyltransferase MnmC